MAGLFGLSETLLLSPVFHLLLLSYSVGLYIGPTPQYCENLLFALIVFKINLGYGLQNGQEGELGLYGPANMASGTRYSFMFSETYGISYGTDKYRLIQDPVSSRQRETSHSRDHRSKCVLGCR